MGLGERVRSPSYVDTFAPSPLLSLGRFQKEHSALSGTIPSPPPPGSQQSLAQSGRARDPALEPRPRSCLRRGARTSSPSRSCSFAYLLFSSLKVRKVPAQFFGKFPPPPCPATLLLCGRGLLPHHGNTQRNALFLPPAAHPSGPAHSLGSLTLLPPAPTHHDPGQAPKAAWELSLGLGCPPWVIGDPAWE